MANMVEKRAVIGVLIEDESGALARVVGLFSGRGYNIESLTVASIDPEARLSRITIVTTGTADVIEQIKAQLARLVPVHRVRDLGADGPCVARELAMVKVVSTGETRTEGLRIADAFRARVVDTTSGSFVFELTGTADKVDAFVDLMRPLGLAELSRTGVAAMARGPGVL
ncbi:acetolactate synthase small subunit [Tanticharoenia sakaeratensis]|jgi:acetolactate synthase I/III small subunit|uniref:Acetolactate synthase small subunit n=1 Tax=Tanticharoenia sakaeratensis NBRC 103193 TaxID=1231623 RepID=A0A0D6MPX1_9PROT|nr:acetolactate synthase small subunit [Tanticharoenia sakaeratensis]GAN55737.1 acetolactate synthase 3 regulatory subunit [Tanticharoenia sakaeratensis NBRC 103193]GBQ18497.1 acetolactate synthase 3 regulatory subunit [Tanticharoenia sakaeratensis NBRC 103193]